MLAESFGVKSNTNLSEHFIPEVQKNITEQDNPSAFSDASFVSSGASGGAKFPGGIAGNGAGLILNHSLLIRNSRRAMQDTPSARTIADRFASLGADIGIKLESTPQISVLGISSETARAWARNTEARFHLWCMSKKQNRSEVENFYQLQKNYMFWQQRDNDMFMRLYYNYEDKILNPVQFEAIDPTQIRGTGFTFSAFPNGIIKDGIIRDERNREIGYSVSVKQPNGSFQEVILPATNEDRSRNFMLHGYMREYAGQGRGYSRFSHTIQEFQNLTDFDLAHIQKAINESSLLMATENDQQAPSNLMEQLQLGGKAGPAVAGYGSVPVAPEGAENVTADSLNNVSYCDIPEATLRGKGSVGVFTAAKGDKIKQFDNKAPVASYDSFVTAFTASLSASMNMPIEVLLMKFNQNYSASRATLILFWRHLEQFRNEMAIDLLNPVYEMWLSEEIANEKIIAPGWSDPVMREAWLSNVWVGAPVPDIDPSRTAKAFREQLSLGITNADRLSRGLNGTSFEDNQSRLIEEYGEAPPPPWRKPSEGEQSSDIENMLSDFKSDIEDMFEDLPGGN